jgi:hypothetical protein
VNGSKGIWVEIKPNRRAQEAGGETSELDDASEQLHQASGLNKTGEQHEEARHHQEAQHLAQ